MSAPQVATQQPPSEILLLIAAAFYLCTAAVTLVAMRAGQDNPVREHRQFARDWKRDNRLWITLAVLLVLAAIYRAANIEYLIDSSLRSDLIQHDMYATRHDIQARFVLGGLFVGIVLVGGSDWLLRRRHPAIRLAAAGGIGLLLLLGVRAVSAHAIDAALRLNVGGLRLGLLAEPAMLAVIAGAALWFRKWRCELPTEIASRRRSRSDHAPPRDARG